MYGACTEYTAEACSCEECVSGEYLSKYEAEEYVAVPTQSRSK